MLPETSAYDDWPPVKQDSGRNWGDAKLAILKILWAGNLVEGSEVFKEIQQTEYDRRIRELRESGWQIETIGTKYRLISHHKLPGNKRTYPSPKQKKEVFLRDKGICQICRSQDGNIQYDHKVPWDRLGQTEVKNLQLLCRPCNVEKRGACKRCTLETCEDCPYAYPELYGTRMVLMLDSTIVESIRNEASTLGIPDKVLAINILSHRYNTNSKEG